jgi:large subunit ribosomal protein L21
VSAVLSGHCGNVAFPNADALRTAAHYNRDLCKRALRLPRAATCGSLDGFFLPQTVMTYAIIKTGGRQFRVAEGDTIDVDLLDIDPGKTATFGDVLMFADGKNVTHGDPVISGANVTAEVVEQRKDKKVIAFKYKRRKGYHRTVGHRRKLTRVKIKSISVGAKKTAAKE